MEVAQIENPAERAEFLKALGVEEPAIHVLTRLLYKALGYISFFTTGEDEVRAWTIRHGATAVDAAHAIHSDLARGFIRAEVMKYNELIGAPATAGHAAEVKLKETGQTAAQRQGLHRRRWRHRPYPPQRLRRSRGGFQFLEGPVWVSGGSSRDSGIVAEPYLLFTDIPASSLPVYKMTSSMCFASRAARPTAMRSIRKAASSRANTRTAASAARNRTARSIALATHYEGKRLNSPNDIVCRERRLGVLQRSAVRRETRTARTGFSRRVPHSPGRARRSRQLLVRDFVKPNGLAFSPDEKILYIADTELGHIRAFDVNADGTIANSRVFCKVEHPDGFRVDIEGNLYISAIKSVEVFDRTGRKRGEITLPEQPANVAFGDADRQTLYICARTSLVSRPRERPRRQDAVAATFISHSNSVSKSCRPAVVGKRDGSVLEQQARAQVQLSPTSARANSPSNTRKFAAVLICFFAPSPEKSK